MPDWSLQRARGTARGIAVWFAWFLLTGYLTHDRSYGELKRLDRWVVLRQLSFLAFTVGFLWVFVTNIAPGAAFWMGWGLILGVGFGSFVVGSYFAITWVADRRLAA